MDNRDNKINEVITLLKGKPACYMKIFIFRGKEIEPRYYKQVPWEKNIDVTCTDKATADELIFLLQKLQNAASANPKITGIEYYEPI